MEIVNLILNIAVIVLIFLVGLFTKNYLQSYMDKKEKIQRQKRILKRLQEKQRKFKESLKKNLKHFHPT